MSAAAVQESGGRLQSGGGVSRSLYTGTPRTWWPASEPAAETGVEEGVRNSRKMSIAPHSRKRVCYYYDSKLVFLLPPVLC